MSSGSVLQVVILQGGSLVGTEMLVPGDYRIGRSDECDLHLDEPTLSRVHARLVFNGTRVGIQDLKSDNGVIINGEKVAAREVKSLDDVTLGKVTLKFKVIPRKDSGPPAPADEKKELNKTVPLAARPDAAALRAAAGMPSAGPTEVASNPLAEARAAAATTLEGRGRGGLSDPEITAPGTPSEFNSTQPSARRGQVAPELAPAPPAPMPPRPVIGLVPPPPPAPAAAPVPAPKAASPRPALVPPPKPTPPPEPPPAPKVQLAPPPAPPEVATRSAKPAAVPPPPEVKAKSAPVAELGKSAKAPMDRTMPKAARAELLSTSYADPGVELLQPGQQPCLRVRVWWGDQTVALRTFEYGTEVKAADSDQAGLPLYNFGLAKPTVLAQVHSAGWAMHVPAGVSAEVRAQRGWESMQPSMDPSGVGIVPIQPGTFARLSRGMMKVEFFALAPQVKLPRAPPKIELSLLIPFLGAMCAVASLIIFMPSNLDAPDFTPKALPALRAALVPPTPKEKPKPKEKEKPAEKKEKEPTKQAKTPPPPQKKQPPPQAPVAVAALAKLTSSPAMSNLLSAANKMTGGGRPSGLKMVGLKGIGPVALAGNGPGTGGGFGGGMATGGELLRGVTGIGIAHALKGTPQGQVQSPARMTQIHGSMSREEIAKVVNAHYQQIRQCYEKALLREPGLTGKLAIEWTIDSGGGVSQVKTKSSTMKSDEVVDCINDNVKTWRFPKPTGGEVVVNYPFIFNSGAF